MSETLPDPPQQTPQEFGVFVDIKKLINDPEICALVKLTAMRLQTGKSSYFQLGSWIGNLPDVDLYILQTMLENCTPQPNDLITKNMVCLVMMLIQAEGIPLSVDNHTHDNLNALFNFIVLESLSRQGLAQIYRENFTFDKDSSQLPIATMIPPPPQETPQ